MKFLAWTRINEFLVLSLRYILKFYHICVWLKFKRIFTKIKLFLRFSNLSSQLSCVLYLRLLFPRNIFLTSLKIDAGQMITLFSIKVSTIVFSLCFHQWFGYENDLNRNCQYQLYLKELYKLYLLVHITVSSTSTVPAVSCTSGVGTWVLTNTE